VQVEGGEHPYYAYGRAYIRVGDEERQISAKQLENLILTKNRDRLRWDSEVCPKVTVDDIGTGKLRSFLKLSGLTFDTVPNSFEKLNLVQDGKLLNAAVLCFARANWSKRELQNQIERGSFERTMLADLKLAPPVRELHQDVAGTFKDTYLLDFLNLPEPHLEADLQAALLHHMRKFLLELGDGFAFVGEKVRIQVGNRDFALDLLFYHRDLQCLVAFELKTGQFEPSRLGQLSFYLEALDRDRKRPHENPSIGVLLCRRKDDEVVEYALSRNLSPALVAEYETRMIPRQILREKLHEWRELLEAHALKEDEQF